MACECTCCWVSCALRGFAAVSGARTRLSARFSLALPIPRPLRRSKSSRAAWKLLPAGPRRRLSSGTRSLPLRRSLSKSAPENWWTKSVVSCRLDWCVCARTSHILPLAAARRQYARQVKRLPWQDVKVSGLGWKRVTVMPKNFWGKVLPLRCEMAAASGLPNQRSRYVEVRAIREPGIALI